MARRRTSQSLVAAIGLSFVPSAFAQSEFRLDLGFVARSGTGAGADPLTDLPGSIITINSGQRVRLELRYRLSDLNPQNNITARGLADAGITIGHNAGANAGIMHAADLTVEQSGDNNPQPIAGAVNPDATGIFDPSDITGLINEFRGLVFDPGDYIPHGAHDDAPANGYPREGQTNRLGGDSFTIRPHSISAGGVNNQRSDAAPGTQMWGLYCWWFTPTVGFSGDVVFAAGLTPSPTSPAYTFYQRNGSATDVVPRPGELFSEGRFTVHVVPAPGSIALVLLTLAGSTFRRGRGRSRNGP